MYSAVVAAVCDSRTRLVLSRLLSRLLSRASASLSILSVFGVEKRSAYSESEKPERKEGKKVRKSKKQIYVRT